ncbi:TonB-dependent receptor [Phocaeicola sp.]|uniref:TonB-dependent receptor n=1 Tax=Phocaeicola sp. TaxID=2773926 RepID=UPI0023D39EDD|nr:TonB-dependent receptor [Phocaeicola sp.]MDE5677965.1 TonB-dependent receptor [Phocaeicola sp.]
MQKILKNVCLICCCLMVIPISAQRIISGTVFDENKEPLIGATLSIKGKTTLGTTTDAQGKYMLKLPNNNEYLLKVSYIGYISQTYKISVAQAGEIDFLLKEDAVNMATVVVTGTRTPKLLKDVPIVTRVITADEIKKVDATHIGDLLQAELPGIEFSYSMDQQVSLNMQGFGGNAVLFLVDGERLAGETLDNIDYNRLNMDNVERIEIVKGAASSLYGSNAVGGVVNVISKMVTKPWAVNINGRYGAYNDQRYGGTIGFNAGKFSSVTNVQHTQVDEKNLADGKMDEETGDWAFKKVYGDRTWNVKERLIYTANDRMKLTARVGYFFRERDKSPTNKDRYRDFSGGVKGNYMFDTANELEIAYSFDQYDKSDYLLQAVHDVRDYSNVQHSVRTFYNHTFADKHILTLGGDYMRDYLMSYQFADNGSKYQYIVDGFAQFDWNLTKYFNVIAGLRFDYYSDSDINHFSPKLGLMYKVGNCSLRGAYAGGFRAPTLKEMYMSFDMASIFMIYGNPDLKPETSHNFSLSAEYIKGRYNLTVTGFYNMVGNRITTAWSEALKGQVYTNISNIRISGAEVNASAKYSCGLAARLSYAYTYENIKKGQPVISTTRPHTATVRVEYDKNWKNYGLNIALNGRFLSKVNTEEYTSNASYEETETMTYPAYTMWKLILSQKIWEGARVSLTVDNLFNYVPSRYYNNSPATRGTTFSAGLSLDIDRLFK